MSVDAAANQSGARRLSHTLSLCSDPRKLASDASLPPAHPIDSTQGRRASAFRMLSSTKVFSLPRTHRAHHKSSTADRSGHQHHFSLPRKMNGLLMKHRAGHGGKENKPKATKADRLPFFECSQDEENSKNCGSSSTASVSRKSSSSLVGSIFSRDHLTELCKNSTVIQRWT